MFLAPLFAQPETAQPESESQWETVTCEGTPCHRHEHAFVQVGETFVALGGRRVQAVDLYNPDTKVWTKGSKPPLEIHHFQAISHEGKVLVAGAMTGRFPGETPIGHLYFYDPSADEWSKGPAIPQDRQRGSAGAFIKGGKLYMVCGIIDGHRSGWVPWFDCYDFETDTWTRLPDAPRARDHFQAVCIDDSLVLVGGRRSGENGHVFASVIPEVDLFDFKTNTWKTLDEPLAVPRAGTASIALDREVLLIGGESKRPEAYSEVDAFHVDRHTWRALPSLPGGRHATQPVLFGGHLYLQAGSITRGGRETNTMIRIPQDKLGAPEP